MSDIEFLSIKEFDGKLKTDEGTLSATGTLATLTASAGKDMYFARGKVAVFWVGNTSAAQNDRATIELQLNGTVIETYDFGKTAAGSGNGSLFPDSYEFVVGVGQKVAATQIIKLEVTQISADLDVEGAISCFEEDTGASPQIT